ncbi:MAG TPA: ATP-dependent RNA helicase RhlB [Ignavibacteriaceae bacterium]|nr:ATP-dependent RNA helicase RhlB [Ignavibacteriaceae bacterium]
MNIFKKISEKFRSKDKNKNDKKSEKSDLGKSWEKRKAELMANAPGSKSNKTVSAKNTEKGSRSSKKNIVKKRTVAKDKAPTQVRNQSRKPVKKTVDREVKQTDWSLSKFDVQPEEGKTRFHDFDLSNKIMHAISDLGFKYSTPIQAELLKDTLKGKDAIGQAQTGTGKTAAFLITIFSKFQKEAKDNAVGIPRALILAPTRELVLQITSDAKLLGKYLNLKVIAVFGGMDYQKQRQMLNNQVVDIIVATPGRLLDFCSKDDIKLDKVEILVIDEADRMLDMGFIPDVKKIVKMTPDKSSRQTMFFSATLTADVRNLSHQWTKDPAQVSIDPEQVSAKSVEQKVYIVTDDEKYPLLYNLIVNEKLDKVMVFCNRKDEATRIGSLLKSNEINSAVISGDVDQRKRLRVLNGFKDGKIKVLVATDVAGRGIHIEGVSHVINYTLPDDPEDYVHRIGRTGRAGASGISISFASEDDSFNLPSIEKFIGKKLNYTHPDNEMVKSPPRGIEIPKTQKPKKQYNRSSRNNRR